LSTINWTNRLFGDEFSTYYGADETTARAIVDRAIEDWERVVVDFNYAGGGNSFDLEITADPGTAGVAFIPADAVDASGKPTRARINLDDNGGGGGLPDWYFDPDIGDADVPDDSDFTDVLSRFAAGGADNGDGVGLDFYTVVLHEIGHALGLGTSPSSLAINDFIDPDPVLPDPVNPGGPGDVGNSLYAFNVGGGAIEATFTDAGSGDEDNLFPAHLYEGPATAATLTAGLPTHPNDLMNDGRSVGGRINQRKLISNTSANVLALAYGYTVALPSEINTFHASLNTTNGTLSVRGDAGATNDGIIVDVVGSDVRVRVNGTSERVPVSEVASIVVFGNDGNDSISLLDVPAGVPVSLNGGAGNDLFQVGDGDLDTNLRGAVTVTGGLGGNDVLFVNDQSDAGADGYTLDDTTVAKSSWGAGPLTFFSVESVVLNANGSANVINLDGALPTTRVTVNASGGNDVINVGGGDLDFNVRNNVTVNGADGADTLTINDQAGGDPDAYTVSSDVITKTNFGTLALASVSALTLNANAGDNAIAVVRNPSGRALTVNAGGGADVVSVGDGDIDSAILDDVAVNGGAGADALLLEDADDATGNDNYFIRAATFNKFSFPGTLTFGTVESLTLTANLMNNIIEVDSTAAAAVTVNARGGDDQVRVGDGDIDSNLHRDLFVNGGGGNDTLSLNDQADDSGNDTHTLTDATYDKTNYAGLLGHAFVESIVLNAGPFNDTVAVQSTAGGGAVPTLNTAGGNDVVDVVGTHPATPVIVRSGDGQDVVNVNADAGGGTAAAVFDAGVESLAALTIGPAGTATLSPGAAPGQRVLVAGSFSATGTGRLDLTNGGFIIDYAPGSSPLASVQSALASGYAGGAWAGSGITSSTAAADPAGDKAVGYAENDPAVGGLNRRNFLGQAVDASSLLLRYTLEGDADLSGGVGVADLGRLSTHFGQQGRRWDQGDFSFDLFVNVTDLGLLSSNFNELLA
jgi:hypothetical protein